MIRTYYLLTKPRIIMGNLITTVSGFILASKGHFNLWLFLVTMLGLGFVIGSACVFNNCIDRFSDQKMARTKNRPIPKGLISVQSALIFASIIGLLGVGVLYFYTNALASFIAMLGFFIYVILYSFWKHHSSLATLVGSIAGATPPVVGYCAVSQSFDIGAALFFIILVLWQMPHFFSIAMFRVKEYAAAAIPSFPDERGNFITKLQMLLYIIGFCVACFLLIAFGYTGYFYLTTAAILSLSWLYLCLQGFKSKNDQLWARKMFRLSLVIITLLCIVISVDAL